MKRKHYTPLLLTLICVLAFSCQKEKPMPAPTPAENSQPQADMDSQQGVDSIAFAQREAPKIKADISAQEFQGKHGPELEMLLMKPIYSKIFDNDGEITGVLPQLSQGQQALYFSRKMDEAMTEGGMEMLLKAKIAPHLHHAAQAFEEVGDKELSRLAELAYQEYLRQNTIAKPGEAQSASAKLQTFDADYQKARETSLPRLEEYIRAHPGEFVEGEQ